MTYVLTYNVVPCSFDLYWNQNWFQRTYFVKASLLQLAGIAILWFSDFDSDVMSWKEEVEKKLFSIFPESWQRSKNCMGNLQQDDKDSSKSWWLFADEEHDDSQQTLEIK